MESPPEEQLVGVVNEAVEDGVSQGRVGGDGVPLIDGELRGHDGGAGLTTIVDDLQQVPGLGRCQGCEAPVSSTRRWTLASRVSSFGCVLSSEFPWFDQRFFPGLIIKNPCWISSDLVTSGA